MRWLVIATPRPVLPGEIYPVTVLQEAGCAPGPVWTVAENLTFAGIRSPSLDKRQYTMQE